jgi:hypothetical protein
VERRQSEFSALLNKGRLVISFLDPLFEVRLSSHEIRSSPPINNYSWLPDEDKRRFTNRLINGSGTGMKLVQKDHLFSSYFSAYQKDLNFTAYIDILFSTFDLGEVFITNSTDLTVGFSLKISNGLVVFIPRFTFNEDNNRKFIGVLLQIAKKYFGSEIKIPPPDWVNAFTVPGAELLDEEIHEIEIKISELDLQKTEILIRRDDLNNFNFLLYEQGDTLQRKVVEALRLIGFKAETVPGENTDFDVIMEGKEGRAIAEIEGKDDSSIHKEKIDQLLSAINQDVERGGAFAKGILIGNPYRLKAIEQRGEPFTDTVMRLAKQYHYALLTTVELYNATVYVLENPTDEKFKEICRRSILDSDGEIVKFPIP